MVRLLNREKKHVYRPALASLKRSYLFESDDRYQPLRDIEFHNICQDVIQRECLNRIFGPEEQDPIAILKAVGDHPAFNSTEDPIEYYQQFYNRIELASDLQQSRGGSYL